MDDTTFIHSLVSYAERVVAGGQLTGDELGSALKHLTSVEVAEGGPYATRHGKLDLADNLAIAYFLRVCDVRLKNLDDYIADMWRRRGVRSAWERELKRRIDRIDAKGQEKERSGGDSVEEDILSGIQRAVTARFSKLPEELRVRSSKAVQDTIDGNPDRQMTLMALYMRQALGKKGRKFSDKKIVELGLSNAFFWTAFIIYDDFWDEDEAADPLALPAANLLARHYTDHFSRLFPESTGFRRYFHDTMDRLDGANAWEVSKCRMKVEGRKRYMPSRLPAYRDFGIKFYPAAGHIMGPVSMLVELGYHALSSEVHTLASYFEHYLVAMQINDDAHDWKEDLERGHMSTVVTLLLKKWSVAHPQRHFIDMDKDMAELERLYWFETIVPACKAVFSHTKKSRAALGALTCVENTLPLERFILRNEAIAREALQEHERSGGVIRAFSKKSS